MFHLLRFAAALLLVAGSVAPAAAQGAPAGFGGEFLRQFESSSRKLIALAEAMPESSYTWSPGEGVMPVGRVYAHIASYNYRYPQQAFGAALPAGLTPEAVEETTGKAQVVEALRQSTEHVRRVVGGLSDAQLAEPARLYGRDTQRWAVLFQLLAHMNEHLGQSIAYARMNGVVPPWSQ